MPITTTEELPADIRYTGWSEEETTFIDVIVNRRTGAGSEAFVGSENLVETLCLSDREHSSILTCNCSNLSAITLDRKGGSK